VTMPASVTAPATQRRQRVPLYALYAANLISLIGDVMMFLAVPWFVLETTGSIAQTGITAFFSTGAVAAAALLGSAFVDRLGFQRASVVSDLASGIAVALIPLLYATVGLPFWALLALVFVAGLLTTPGMTARAALVPDLAALAEVRFERATALTDGVSRLARFFGAPLAGVLLALFGRNNTDNLLWIDAATFGVSALLIGGLVPRGAHRSASKLVTETATETTAPVETSIAADEPVAEPTRRRLFGNAREGLAFIARDPVLAGTTLVVLVTNMLDAGYGGVVLPAYVKQVYGSAVVQGAMIAAFGGAAFVGALAFGAVGHRLPRRPTLGWGFLIGGATRFFWLLLLAQYVPLLIAVQAICGFCIGPINPIFSTIDYERVPPAMRARAFGAMTAGGTLGVPLGGLLAGGLAPLIGVTPCIVLFGAIYLVATGSLLVNPALRALDAKSSPALG